MEIELTGTPRHLLCVEVSGQRTCSVFGAKVLSISDRLVSFAMISGVIVVNLGENLCIVRY